MLELGVKYDCSVFPAGYANGLKAIEPGSIILVLSDKVLSEALKDSWRYPPHKWNVF